MRNEVKVGRIFSTGSAHGKNLRKLRVEVLQHVKDARGKLYPKWAHCRVARGPNAKFYNSLEVVRLLVSRLQCPSKYRKSEAKSEKRS